MFGLVKSYRMYKRDIVIKRHTTAR